MSKNDLNTSQVAEAEKTHNFDTEDKFPGDSVIAGKPALKLTRFKGRLETADL